MLVFLLVSDRLVMREEVSSNEAAEQAQGESKKPAQGDAEMSRVPLKTAESSSGIPGKAASNTGEGPERKSPEKNTKNAPGLGEAATKMKAPEADASIASIASTTSTAIKADDAEKKAFETEDSGARSLEKRSRALAPESGDLAGALTAPPSPEEIRKGDIRIYAKSSDGTVLEKISLARDAPEDASADNPAGKQDEDARYAPFSSVQYDPARQNHIVSGLPLGAYRLRVSAASHASRPLAVESREGTPEEYQIVLQKQGIVLFEPRIVFVVDESTSMKARKDLEGRETTLEWLAGAPEMLEELLSIRANLRLKVRPRYALFGFNRETRNIPLNNGVFGDGPAFTEALPQLGAEGDVEDGYKAIGKVLELEDGGDKDRLNLLLFTDEDRDVLDKELDFDRISKALVERRAVLTSVVSCLFYAQNKTVLFGVGKAGNGNGRVGYTLGKNGILELPVDHAEELDFAGATDRDYIELALKSGGTAWTIFAIKNPAERDRAAIPFSITFFNNLAAQILGQAPELPPCPFDFVLEPFPRYVRQGQSLTLDASKSLAKGANRKIAAWEWDTDGDGAADQFTPGVNIVFNKTGEQELTLTLRDDGFPAEEMSLPITIHVEE